MLKAFEDKHFSKITDIFFLYSPKITITVNTMSFIDVRTSDGQVEHCISEYFVAYCSTPTC